MTETTRLIPDSTGGATLLKLNGTPEETLHEIVANIKLLNRTNVQIPFSSRPAQGKYSEKDPKTGAIIAVEVYYESMMSKFVGIILTDSGIKITDIHELRCLPEFNVQKRND